MEHSFLCFWSWGVFLFIHLPLFDRWPLRDGDSSERRDIHPVCGYWTPGPEVWSWMTFLSHHHIISCPNVSIYRPHLYWTWGSKTHCDNLLTDARVGNLVDEGLDWCNSCCLIYRPLFRKKPAARLYANSLIGVGMASCFYHTSRGEARKIFRFGDYAMIATAALVWWYGCHFIFAVIANFINCGMVYGQVCKMFESPYK